MSFERDLQMMEPAQRETLRLLANIVVGTWATAILLFLISLGIVVLVMLDR